MGIFTKKTWKNRQTEYPNRRLLRKENGNTELVTVSREEGIISAEGDAFSAENMNNLEERIESAIGSGTLPEVLGNNIVEAVQRLNSNTVWKKLSQINQVGDSPLNLDVNFNELCIKANIDGATAVVTLTIPKDFLQSTGQFFRSGYYFNHESGIEKCNGGMASFWCSEKVLTLNSAYLNGENVTENTAWIVYYK